MSYNHKSIVNYKQESPQSVLNQSTTPLLNGETFTGSFEKSPYPDVGVSLQTDADATLFFDFSPDGVNINTFPPAGFSITSGTHEFHTAVKLARWFRVRVVNASGADATYMRLYVYYGTFRQPNLPLNFTIADDADTIITRNPYDPIEIARGNVQNVSKFSKFGENPLVATTTSIVSSSGTYQMPSTAQTLEILSSDANDTSAGTGARTIRITGLDSSFLELEEDVLLNGTTPVAVSNSFIRVYRLSVLTAGDYDIDSIGSNRGTITLRNSGAGVIWATITVLNGFGVGQSLTACYTVPAGKSLYLDGLELSSSTNKTASIILAQRVNANDTIVPVSGLRLFRSFTQVDSTTSIDLKGLNVFPQYTDIVSFAYTSAGNAAVSVSFNGALINDVV